MRVSFKHGQIYSICWFIYIFLLNEYRIEEYPNSTTLNTFFDERWSWIGCLKNPCLKSAILWAPDATVKPFEIFKVKTLKVRAPPPSPRLKASVWKAVNQGPDVNPPGVGPVFRKRSKRFIPSENAWWVKGSSNEKRSLKDSRIWGNCSSLPR